MAKSQNGWDVITSSSDKRLVKTDKIIGRVRGGDVETIFAHFISWFDKNVEDVDKGDDDWGWANRPIRGGTAISNHASGTAIDLNATRHPMGKEGTFTSEQEAKIREQLKFYEGALRWGGDYSGRKDEMHVEINANAKKVAEIAQKIKGGSKPSRSDSKPSGTSQKSSGKTDSIVDYLKSQGRDSSFSARSSLAAEYGIKGYKGTASQNLQLLGILRKGQKPTPKPSQSGYRGNSIVDYLKSVGRSSSFQSRRILARRHGIEPYSGTASQNAKLLRILRGF